MAVILMILKVIGIVLLVVLGLLVLIVATVLFVPIRYTVECRTVRSVRVGFSVTWLLHAVKLQKGLSTSRVHLYLFGINILDIKQPPWKKKKKKLGGSIRRDNQVEVTDDMDDAPEWQMNAGRSEGAGPIRIETDYEGPEEKVSGGAKKSFPFKRISSIITFIRDSNNKRGLQKIKKELAALFRYLLPGYLRGSLVFGTGDPCTTGWILGVISMIPAAYEKGMQITPDFEEQKLEADVYARGRVHMIYFLLLFFRGYMDRDIKNLIQKALNN